jgi:Fic family protein
MSDVADAAIILPPKRYVRSRLTQLRKFADCIPATHTLAGCAMLHYQIAAIHPFSDANGRVVRALTPSLLRHFGLITRPYLFVSEVLLMRRWDYFIRLSAMERYEERAAWIRFFVDALVEQLRNNVQFLRLARHLRTSLREIFTEVADAQSVAAALDEIFVSTVFKQSRIAAILNLPEDRVKALLDRSIGRFGLSKAVSSADPIYQFGDLYDILAL